MGEEKLVYNVPFEVEEWSWEINDTIYHIEKYRLIECDSKAGYYNDCNYFDVKNEENEISFPMKKYHREKRMNLYCDPYNVLKDDLNKMLELLQYKYKIKEFFYFSSAGKYMRISFS
ncbi:hypothetical protein [Bacillus suaedaesalsae]|uniref:Uncharacterized protein n=1 Tax=Bacillus suaedaesalsae TaxID=2810349 RepID=A0ABS2DE02_9BACI|nr:hypothetical protein [Bacillus suaedaesalsae]MBM6616690.1 hypothetical protein [Bacillus suaedaesalsae]